MATYKPLSTDFKDDILASQNSKRKYTQVNNSDGTVSFQDSTAYSQVGSSYGAKEIIEEREAINNIYANKLVTLDEIDLVTEPGFFVDAQVVKELNSKLKILKAEYIAVNSFGSSSTLYSDIDFGKECAGCYTVGTILVVNQTPWTSSNWAMFRGCKLDENGRGRIYCVGSSFVNGHGLGCFVMAAK